MKGNRTKIEQLKRLQQEIKNVTPAVYAAIAIGLVEEYKWTPEEVQNLFEYTQSLWSECTKKDISMREWCLELTGIDMQGYVGEKAKVGGNNG
jgi:hypothetical protein